MKKIIQRLPAWFSLAIILAADMGYPLALRLEGAAAVFVGIVTVAYVLCIAGACLEASRVQMRRDWSAASWTAKTYSLLTSMAWLAVLAWVGWLWAFGIRLVWVAVWSAVVTHRDS